MPSIALSTHTCKTLRVSDEIRIPDGHTGSWCDDGPLAVDVISQIVGFVHEQHASFRPLDQIRYDLLGLSHRLAHDVLAHDPHASVLRNEAEDVIDLGDDLGDGGLPHPGTSAQHHVQ